MLPEAVEHFVQGSCYQRGGSHKDPSSHVGEYDELLTLVKKRKVKRFGHVSRPSVLAKTILQGTLKGKKKKRQTEEEVGRQY